MTVHIHAQRSGLGCYYPACAVSKDYCCYQVLCSATTEQKG